MTPDKSADEPMLEICESCLEEISPGALALSKKAQAGEIPPKNWTFYNPISK
jgi:hypothetical protein